MALEQFRIDGKVALITGGNRGIGFAIAKLFAEAGATLMLTSRRRTPQLDELLAANPERCAWVEADLIDPKAPDAIVNATIEQFGRLDILVNNAGVAADGDFHDFDDERLAFIMDTNLIAPFRVARAAIKPMLEQGGGTIVNIGSISARTIPRSRSPIIRRRRPSIR